MTVLDSGQRYLRLDESDTQETIVVEGVTFVDPKTSVMSILLLVLWRWIDSLSLRWMC